MFDAELYRDKAEVEQWKQRDPIATFSQMIRAQRMADDALIAALDVSVSDEVDQAVQFAEAGSWEPAEDLLKDVYSGAA